MMESVDIIVNFRDSNCESKALGSMFCGSCCSLIGCHICGGGKCECVIDILYINLEFVTLEKIYLPIINK